jgi:hypothetical protein
MSCKSERKERSDYGKGHPWQCIGDHRKVPSKWSEPGGKRLRRPEGNRLFASAFTLDKFSLPPYIDSVSTVDNLPEDAKLELLQGTLEVLILRSLKLEPNHAYGISQFLQQQVSGRQRIVVSRPSTSSPTEMDCRAVEDFAERAPRQVLQPHAGRAERTPQGNVEVAAIRRSDGKDSSDAGMSQ